ncbi:MAG TPA: ATP-binding protein [Granulicella sp.]|jgi:signal transduction histidine kinase|nr:ATP-binding protein [Granulicella sp.]
MRLKTKLVLAATSVTFGIVLLLSLLFLGELLRQRIAQTAAANNVLANEVRLATRQALETRLPLHPNLTHPLEPALATSQDALHAAVTEVLREDAGLKALMEAIVRYSPTVQDVSVTDARGISLVSTDPEMLNQPASARTSLGRVSDGSVLYQARELFGRPQVLDIDAPLERNGRAFLVVHVGVRSTFLRASYAPWLNAALWFALLAAGASVIAAGLLSSLALRPIEAIHAQLELLSAGVEDDVITPSLPTPRGGNPDTVVRVAKTIDRLERQMRSKEAGYTALKTNLNQMLDTLRDGVVLFAGERSADECRAVMVSDAVANFVPSLNEAGGDMIGLRVEEIFAPETELGAAVLRAFATGRNVAGQVVLLEDGRQVQISLDQIQDGQGSGGNMGTLLTLRDMESAMQLERELEVSRRLAAIGRITAGVGHEVKNPINAMVLHLELLRGKLLHGGEGSRGAQRHVEILASEMQRLDRAVQTLADFSRPIELHLRVLDLRDVVAAVAELTSVQMREAGVRMVVEVPRDPLLVHVDSDLMRQALLNLVLNAMQAMSEGGVVWVRLRREQHLAAVEVADQGTGILPELLPRIFELYFTTKKSGSGIGLAMTYRILQMHGGALDVRSNADMNAPDHGSVFTLRLPISVLSGSNSGPTSPLPGLHASTRGIDSRASDDMRGRGERA